MAVETTLATYNDVTELAGQLRAEIASAIAEAVAEANLGRGVDLLAGQWYGPDTPATTNLVMVANTLYLAKFRVSQSGIADIARVRLAGAGAAATVIRLGIYDFATLELLHTWGTAPGDGANGVKSTESNPVEVEPGAYLLAAAAEGGAPTILGIVGGTDVLQASTVSTLNSGYARSVLTTTGELPAALTQSSLNAAIAPRIIVQGA